MSNGDITDQTTAFLDTATFLDGVANPPSVMTTSYGQNENLTAMSVATYVFKFSKIVEMLTDRAFSKLCNAYMALGTRGISVIYASGDGGVRGGHDEPSQCTSNDFIAVFPASCPFVTSVGSTIGVLPERAINFTGGGFSNFFARPWYQDVVVPEFLATIPKDFPGVFNKSGRGYPDVSTSARILDLEF